MRWLLYLIFLSLSVQVFTVPLTEDEQTLTVLLNNQRLLHNVPALPNLDSQAQVTASRYAKTLLTEQNLSHTTSQGLTVLDRYRLQHGTALMVGEILASGPTLHTMLEGWLNSPSHYEALMNSHWTTMAVAVVHQNNRYIACVFFTNGLAQTFSYNYKRKTGHLKAILYNKNQSNLDVQIGNQPIYYTTKRHYLKAQFTIQKGDYIVLSNAYQQGNIIMVQ